MQRISWLTMLIVLFVLIAVGCSAPATPTPTPLPPATATVSPQAELIAGAQKEGTLTVYTSLNETEANPLLAKFTAKYPFIKTTLNRASSADVVKQVLAEGQAGQNKADVMEMDGMDLLQVYNAKLLAAYKSPEAAAYPDSAKQPWGYYTTAYVNALVIAYNTKLVKPEEAPKKLDDLTDPKWSGKIAIEQEDWAMMPFTSKVMGETSSTAFWSKLAAQKPKAISGHTEVATAIISGTVSLSPTVYAHRVEALKKKGEPIEWVKSDPVYAYLQYLGVAAKAPHPNAARLFVDWLLSVEGQNEIANVGRIPARPGITGAAFAQGVKFYYCDVSLIGDPAQVHNQWANLFGIK